MIAVTFEANASRRRNKHGGSGWQQVEWEKEKGTKREKGGGRIEVTPVSVTEGRGRRESKAERMRGDLGD